MLYELTRPITLLKKHLQGWERRRPACIVPKARLTDWERFILCKVRAAAAPPPPPHRQAGRLRSQPCAFPLKFNDYFAKAPTRQSADAKEANCTPKETAAWKR
ncbi:MAG: hypothetical protein JNK74_02030 [Candidatus Hydrogenedentes bacterium]|nr:hypothetical protein [Candidatus Hydrogenedentota bacterium]